MSKFFQHSLAVCEKRFQADRLDVLEGMRIFTKLLTSFLLFILISLWVVPAQAEITAKVSAKDENGFGRIVFRFFKLPAYRARISDGVLIISFDDAISLKIDQFIKPLREYLTVGRIDPNGKAIRFALSKKIRLNTIEAGDRLFVDLLPEPWVGLPPSLPQSVIDEMYAKTKMAEEEKRKLARRAAFKKSKKVLKVRVGQYPTFSRLVFDWAEKVGVKVSRNGNTFTIQFDKLIRTDLTRLKVDPPKFVAGATSKLTDNGLVVEIMLREGANIRAFREGLAYVVDVSGLLDEEEQKELAENTAPPPSLEDNNQTAVKKGARNEVVELEAETPKTVTNAKAATQMPSVVKAPLTPPVMTKKSIKKSSGSSTESQPASKREKAPQMIVSKTSKSGGQSVAMKAEVKSAKREKIQPVPKQMRQAEQAVEKPPVKMATTAAAKSMTPKMQSESPLKIEAELVAGSVRLKFPFSKDVAAAVFKRGEILWAVFDTRRKIDMSALGDGRSKFGRIRGYSLLRTNTSVAVLLTLDRPSLATVSAQGTGWELSVGDFIVTPVMPISLVPGNGSDGLPKITLDLKKPAGLNLFEDPKVGDNIAVVTAYGPPQGIVKSQRFVEFATIATALGIAVQPAIDDLKIILNSNDVVITRKDGLLLSPTGARGEVQPRQAAIDATQAGNINFEQWAQGGAAKFYDRRAELEREIASKSELKFTIAPRMELASLYVGNQLGAEALGTMKILKSINPKIENVPLFHALRGVANLMMRRLKAARFDLTSRGLSRENETKLWMGLLEVAEGKWAQARLSFSNGETSMKNYPDRVKALFRISAARANIEANDTSGARYQLAAMPKTSLQRKFLAEAAFLNGRIFELLTRNDEALDYYNEALSYGDRMVEAETSFYKTMLQIRLRYIKSEEALEQLESQLIAWRGDEVELKVMRELAKLYVARSSFRRGLETMRTATTYYPDTKIGRLIQDDMGVLFNNLFLGERLATLSPIETLSLYYDFRELTPIGRLGDEMIRRLSDTLITVDLLDQAAEILSHQVEKRLKGAARAQVATKLAMVHLLRRLPQKALTTIRRTRQAILPKQVARRRSLIEARALAELGRIELAISVLANLKGKDVDQARAEALWQGEKWQGAGEAFERVLGKAWEGSDKLTDAQRINVLRAAISYTLADDKLGNKRLTDDFGEKMALSSDAQTFKTITSSNGGGEAEFRSVAKKIASIDTLRGFLNEFRKSGKSPSSDAASVPQS